MSEFPKDFDLDNKEFKYAEDLILHGSNSVYLTGKAGTGKSTFLKYIAQNTNKNYVIVAPTGVAALNVGGMTINSFFQLPFTPFVWEMFNNTQRDNFYKFSSEKRRVIENAQLVIIDEISMVRADVIDAIDFRLRRFGGKKNLPFGGKQILFVGDTFQLEPIAQKDEWEILKRYYETPYFFSAKVFKEVNFLNIELKKVYRQKDEKFISLLNKVRTKEAKIEDIQELNNQYTPNFQRQDKNNVITLATRRDIVDVTNATELKLLPEIEFTYEGNIQGKFGREGSNSDDLLPTNKNLVLKVGAQIMFVKNDIDRNWVNGTIGKISSLSESSISVLLNDGETYDVKKATWENIKYEVNNETNKIEEKVIGTFTQYPLKLAWAITIHKSQGLTFDDVIIDMGSGAFSAGHTYVALSRCTTLSGIKLKTPIKPSDIIVRDEVIRLANTANDEFLINEELKNSQANNYYREAIRCLDKNDFLNALKCLLKAIEFRNDLENPLFKRLLSQKLKAINNDAKLSILNSIITNLNREVSDLSKELEVKKEENFNIINQFNLNKEELVRINTRLTDFLKNKEDSNNKYLKIEKAYTDLLTNYQSINQSNTENSIRLENAIASNSGLERNLVEVKADVKRWQLYTLIVAVVFIVAILIFKIHI